MKKFFYLFWVLSSTLYSFAQADFVYNFETVDDIRTTSIVLVEKDAIRTQGHGQTGDNGGAYYVIENNSSDTDNDGDVIRINSTLIARLVPNNDVNVKQFGAKGDNVNDDTQEIQNAIDYCMSNQINELKIPSGTYRISNTLKVVNELVLDIYGNPVVTRPSGIYISGSGVNSTIIRSLSGLTGPMLEFDGVPTKGAYINSGGLEGILFDGGNVGGDDNHGLTYLGWWYGAVKNCKFQNFKGDGVRQISDLTVDPNPDWSASLNIEFQKVGIERCHGYAFNNTEGQGAPSHVFDQCIFVLCKKGGAYIQSSAVKFLNCSFAAIGWSSEMASDMTAGDAYGIHFGGNSLTFNSRHVVEGCEFDNNKTAHIACSYLANSRIANNRFIYEYRPSDGSAVDPIQNSEAIVFAPGSIDEAVRNVEFTSNFFRIYSASPSTFNQAILFNWEHTANVFNVFIKLSTISNNSPSIGGGLQYVNITPYKGYSNSNHHIKNNYVIDNRGIGADNTIVSYGSPAPFYIGTINPATPAPDGSNGDLDVLIYDTPDPIFDNSNFKNLHYNTSTGIFTCPYSGFYKIDVSVTVRDLMVNKQARLHIRKNGMIVFYDYVWGTGNSRINMDYSTRFYANEGDEIFVEIGTDDTLIIEPMQGFNRLVIELDD